MLRDFGKLIVTAFLECKAIPIQFVKYRDFFGTTLFTDLASPRQGQIASCVHVHSHVEKDSIKCSNL